MIVVADTSPLNYLIKIDCATLLLKLYSSIIVPSAVLEELSSDDAPPEVRLWAMQLPDWVQRIALDSKPDPELAYLDAGEREAIQIAYEQGADLLLIDERRGWSEAIRRGLAVTGTLGVLLNAGRQGIADPEALFRRLLKETNFRISPGLEEEFLRRARSLF